MSVSIEGGWTSVTFARLGTGTDDSVRGRCLRRRDDLAGAHADGGKKITPDEHGRGNTVWNGKLRNCVMPMHALTHRRRYKYACGVCFESRTLLAYLPSTNKRIFALDPPIL